MEEIERLEEKVSKMTDSKQIKIKIPQNFEELYIEACKITEEEPDRVEIYKDVDRVMNFIEEHEECEMFADALDPERTCIVIPYEMYQDKRLPPNGITDDDILTISASPGLDKYRSLLVDQMESDEGADLMGNIKRLREWKLSIVSRALREMWEDYCRRYLETARQQLGSIVGIEAPRDEVIFENC